MSNACIVMWCSLARTLPLASFFHSHESVQCCASRTLTVFVGPDPDYLEEPDRSGTPFVHWIACMAWLPCCSLWQRYLMAGLWYTEHELHHIIITH